MGKNKIPGFGAGGPKPAEHSFASLNFLCGLAAFAVLFSHTVATVGGGHPLVAFNFGSLAVEVFMLISGFLMMWHFYERRRLGEAWESPKTCLKFYLRRFFRSAPLYYCILVIVYVFHDLLQHDLAQNQMALHAPSGIGSHDPTSLKLTAGHVLAHFSFLFGFIPCFAASNPLPDWSIGLEMQFYLFFPFLALLLVRTEFVGGVVLLLAVNWLSLHCFGVGINAEPKWLGVFPFPTFLPLQILCFLVGMLLAAGLFEKENATQRTFLLLLAMLVAGLYMKKFLLVGTVFISYELAVSRGTGLKHLDHALKLAGRLIEYRLFNFAADASYGVYLIHVPLLIVVVHLLTSMLPFADYSGRARFFICFGVMVPLVYILAFLAHNFVEKPGIEWGRKIVRRVR